MIRSADFRDLDLDLVPVAIVGRALGATLPDPSKIVRAWDDLDWYDGADLFVGDDLAVSLRRYDGHPAETFTIYVNRPGLGAPGTLSAIMREFGIADHALTWVRQPNEGAGRRPAADGAAKHRRPVA